MTNMNYQQALELQKQKENLVNKKVKNADAEYTIKAILAAPKNADQKTLNALYEELPIPIDMKHNEASDLLQNSDLDIYAVIKNENSKSVVLLSEIADFIVD